MHRLVLVNVVAGHVGAALVGGATAMHVPRRNLKHRSLAPDDPFGERGAWEDPSLGIFSAWQGVDQVGFAKAAESDEVQQAHFGPDWARFASLGQKSVRVMQSQKAEAAVQAAQGPSADSGMIADEPGTAEEVHARKLQRRREIESKNYQTYEEFVEHELMTETGERRSGEACFAQEEDLSAVSVTLSGRGRSAVADSSCSGSTGAGEETPDLWPIPAFARCGASDEGAGPAREENAGGRGDIVCERPPTLMAEMGGDEALMLVAMQWLGTTHGDPKLPRRDPLTWTTDEVVTWTTHFAKAGVMDDTMVEAFRLARVDGEMLLNKVIPSDLFKVMRKWHVKRNESIKAILGAIAQLRGPDPAAECAGPVVGAGSSQSAVQHTAAACAGKLSAITETVTPTLIQETIILCFPYCS